MPNRLSEVNQLARDIEAHLTAIDGLTSAIREDRAFVGGDPCERLNEYQMDAIHHSIEVLSRSALCGFHDVLTKLEIPQ